MCRLMTHMELTVNFIDITGKQERSKHILQMLPTTTVLEAIANCIILYCFGSFNVYGGGAMPATAHTAAKANAAGVVGG